MPAKSPYYARAAGKGLFVRRTDAASVRRRVLRTSGVLAALLLLDSGAAAALCASLRGWRAFPLSVLWRRAFGAEAFVGDAGDCLALALLRSLVLPALLVGGAAWAAPPSEKEARAAGGREGGAARRREPTAHGVERGRARDAIAGGCARAGHAAGGTSGPAART